MHARTRPTTISADAAQIDVDAAIKNALANRLDLVIARKQSWRSPISISSSAQNNTKPSVDAERELLASGTGGTQTYGRRAPVIDDRLRQRARRHVRRRLSDLDARRDGRVSARPQRGAGSRRAGRAARSSSRSSTCATSSCRSSATSARRARQVRHSYAARQATRTARAAPRTAARTPRNASSPSACRRRSTCSFGSAISRSSRVDELNASIAYNRR